MSKATEIFNKAFEEPRDLRSREYMEGVLYILRVKLGETEKKVCPYNIGTTQADAWFSGNSEGHLLLPYQLPKKPASFNLTPKEI